MAGSHPAVENRGVQRPVVNGVDALPVGIEVGEAWRLAVAVPDDSGSDDEVSGGGTVIGATVVVLGPPAELVAAEARLATPPGPRRQIRIVRS